MKSGRQSRLLRLTRLLAAGAVSGLVLLGAIIASQADTGSLAREVGLAALTGGLVGGVFVAVESMLASAAETRSRHEALVAQLSSTIDLNGIDLSGRDLRSLYLPGRAAVAARLRQTKLDGAQLYFGDLRHADLSGASLRSADLSGSTLAFADLSGADLREATLDDVDLTSARLDGADLRGVSIRGGRLQRIDLAKARLSGATIENTYLQGADFTSAEIAGLNLKLNEYDTSTRWPDGYEAPESTPVTQPDFTGMELATYLVLRRTRHG